MGDGATGVHGQDVPLLVVEGHVIDPEIVQIQDQPTAGESAA